MLISTKRNLIDVIIILFSEGESLVLSASEREAGLDSDLNGGESSLLQELPPVNAPVNGCIFGGLPQ